MPQRPLRHRDRAPPELRSLDAVDDELSFPDRWGDVALLATYREESGDAAGGYVAGFAHLPDGPGQWPEGSWGGRVTPRIELGGGWWWVD